MAKYRYYKNRFKYKKLRERVLQRDEFICRQCIKPFLRKELVVHHIKRVIDGGEHILENLVTLCRKCHFKIHRQYNHHKGYENQKEKIDRIFEELSI